MIHKTEDNEVQSQATAVDKEPHITAYEALHECASKYARERPDVVALWALGIGFVLGWKLKPW